jgi:NAD(P)-dependent dehydrogenase (short-subunit alcohol dehydrogenase family)
MTHPTNPPFDHAEFNEKRILVTGGTQGIGEAIVRRLAAAGATVATTARSPLPEGQHPALFVQADVATPAGVEKVLNEVNARFGGVDILVHNVGGSSAPSGGALALTARTGSLRSTSTCSPRCGSIVRSFPGCSNGARA